MLEKEQTSTESIEVPYLKAINVQWGGISFKDLGTMWCSPSEAETLKVQVGDLLVCEGGEIGRAAIVESPPPDNCIIQNAVHLVRPRATGNLRFLRYLLIHATQIGWLDVLCNRATIAHFTSEKFRELPIWLPPVTEQRAIADFLDRETAKIDALIDHKQRLLELLAERWQALITHAVTKGIDPDAPMKDSGVEWLGKIPKDWNIASLKHVAHVRTGVAKGRPLKADEVISVPYLRVANVQDGYLDLDDVAEIQVLPHEVPQYSLRKGDVLMNEGGDADKLGRGAVWDGSIDPCLHQNHVFAVRCRNIEPQWLSLLTSADYAKAFFESRSKQTTNLASISATNLKELPVILPPRNAQIRIVAHVEQQISKINYLRGKVVTIIERLGERRAALINEVVTGKMKVTE